LEHAVITEPPEDDQRRRSRSSYPLCRARDPKLLSDVEGDGLSLAVGVGRDQHGIGLLGRALELCQQLRLALDDKKNGDVAATLANLAEELEDWDLATKTLRTISLLDTDCPISRGQAFLRQGKIAYRMGDQKGALMWARRAKREEPDSGEIDRFIEEIS